MTKVITKPGPTSSCEVSSAAAIDAAYTEATAVMAFDDVANLLASRPLRCPHRQLAAESMDDFDDLAAMEKAKRRAKPRSYDKLRRSLGLS
jgi:hypothetical protein